MELIIYVLIWYVGLSALTSVYLVMLDYINRRRINQYLGATFHIIGYLGFLSFWVPSVMGYQPIVDHLSIFGFINLTILFTGLMARDSWRRAYKRRSKHES